MIREINNYFSNGLQIGKVLPVVLLSALFFSSGCSSYKYTKLAKKQVVTAKPNPIEVHGGKAEVDVTVSVSPEIIKGNYTYATEFIFVTEGDKAKPVQLVRIPFVPGEYLRSKEKLTAAKTLTIPWTRSSENGVVKVRAVLNEKRKYKYLPYQTIAQGFITTYQLAVPEEPIDYISSPYTRKEEQNKYVFYFNNNSSTMKSYVGADSGPLADFLALNNKSKHVKITAYHSPDEKPELARKRAESVREFYIQQVDRNTYRGESGKIKFETEIVTESFQPLLAELKNSPMPQQEKVKVLEILNGSGSYQSKLQRLKKLSNYKYLQDYVYPALRRVGMQAIYERPKKMNFEISLTANRIAKGEVDEDQLTPDEFGYAAELTPLMDEKESLYKAAVRIHKRPQDAYNLGVLYLNKAKKEKREDYKKEYYAAAIHHFHKAAGTYNTPIVYYNLATAYQLHGNHESANQYFDVTTRLQGGEEFTKRVISARAAMLVRGGQYQEAAKVLETAGEGYSASISRGLLALLNQQHLEAAAAFTQASAADPAQGLPHYLLAVTGARSANEELVFSGLKEAVAKDRNFATKAIDDLEFRNYKKNPRFAAAIK